MMGWLIDTAWAGVAQAANLAEPASTLSVVLTNLLTVLPATVAAIAALIVSRHNSAKADALQKSSEATEDKVEEAMSTAAEDVRAHAVVVTEIKDHIAEHSDGLSQIVTKISTAADDIKRVAASTKEIKKAFTDSMETISTVADDVKRMNEAVHEIKEAISVSEEAVKSKVGSKKSRGG